MYLYIPHQRENRYKITKTINSITLYARFLTFIIQ